MTYNREVVADQVRTALDSLRQGAVLSDNLTGVQLDDQFQRACPEVRKQALAVLRTTTLDAP